MEENVITCEICGQIIEDLDNATEVENGVYICNECNAENYVKCDNCGDWIYIDDAIFVDDYYFCSEDCAEDKGYKKCDDCGEWFNYENEGIRTSYGDYVCENCSNNYYYCEHCGEYYAEDDIVYNRRTDEYMCRDCYEDYGGDDDEPDENIFFSYHNWDGTWKPRYTIDDLKEAYTKFKDELKGLSYSRKKDFIISHLLTIGFELETEHTNGDINRIEYCETLNDMLKDNKGSLVHFEEDGSLQDGVEIISQPFTLNYLREHEDLLQKALQKARDMGYTSHNNGRCGLHFHINRNYFGDDNAYDVDKLNLFFETYKENMQLFSRRNDYHYCKFISDDKSLDDTQKLSLKVLNKYKNSTRYYVVNNDNYKTIEIRIMRGTLAFTTFMASAEFVFNLARVIENAEKIGQISWNKVVNYKDTKYIGDYIKERKIKNTIKFLVDKTKVIEREDMMKIDKLFKYIENLNNNNEIINFDMVNDELKSIQVKLSQELATTDDLAHITYNCNKLRDIKDTIGALKTCICGIHEIGKQTNDKTQLIDRVLSYLGKIDDYLYSYRAYNNDTNAINNEKIQELRQYGCIKLLTINY
jgi:hypothetical protein